MSGLVLLGWTSTKQTKKCLAQRHNAVPPVRLKPATPPSRFKHSTIETPHSSEQAKSYQAMKTQMKNLCKNSHSKIDITKISMTNGSLMKVESIAECSPWSILQYFWSALSDNWSWKPIFSLFQRGCFTQVLWYPVKNGVNIQYTMGLISRKQWG